MAGGASVCSISFGLCSDLLTLRFFHLNVCLCKLSDKRQRNMKGDCVCSGSGWLPGCLCNATSGAAAVGGSAWTSGGCVLIIYLQVKIET